MIKYIYIYALDLQVKNVIINLDGFNLKCSPHDCTPELFVCFSLLEYTRLEK